jgi:DNA-binding PadR family transcriptional regulator
MGPGPFFAGGPRAGRGDVRTAILHLLAEQPMHGYQIMQELNQRSGGVWRPSPGSIYPTLQQLEDEGLVRPEETEGKKVYALTDQGRAEVETEDDTPPWEQFRTESGSGFEALRDVGFQLVAAVMQVARAGSDDQVEQARRVLEETRRRLYQILGEGDSSD